MSRRRCFFSCEGKLPLFGLPKEDSVRRRWLQFAFSHLQQQYNPNIFLCALHFTDECFINGAQYNAGFSARLLLKEGAVPTVLSLSADPGLKASIKQKPSGSFTPRCLHVGCQTDPPPTVSVGTQLCMRTLKEHVRSKGIQVQITSTLTKDFGLDFRPAKRPHLELLEEEEEEEEEETAAVTEPSEISYFQANPSERRLRPLTWKTNSSSTSDAGTDSSEIRRGPWSLDKDSSSTSENVINQQSAASSSAGFELQTGSDSSVQSSENEPVNRLEDVIFPWSNLGENAGSSSENASLQTQDPKQKHGMEVAEDRHKMSMCVTDGKYVVDLESPSQLVVDEECLFELLRQCPECSKKCSVRKRVEGLHLLLYQSCYFCHAYCKWSNQPQSDEDDVIQIDTKASALRVTAKAKPTKKKAK
ncbi:hypothetical protein LDENG_00060760 [Lucifuga dentata]|nr:hypothetical protein LDENG_00060760 [Lucifuga dentata]